MIKTNDTPYYHSYSTVMDHITGNPDGYTPPSPGPNTNKWENASTKSYSDSIGEQASVASETSSISKEQAGVVNRERDLDITNDHKEDQASSLHSNDSSIGLCSGRRGKMITKLR
jgi:hypothetical protein